MLADFDAQPNRTVPALPELSATQREADEAELYAGLRGVAGIVAGAQGVIDLLRDMAEFAAQAIPGADGVGVALIDPQQGISSVQNWAATAVLVQEIDTVQYDELNEGPCITCMESGRPTVSGSLGSDSRWPHFGGRVARMRMHSALALPLIIGDQVIGSINAYAKSRDAFAEHAVQLGSRFARPAAVAFGEDVAALILFGVWCGVWHGWGPSPVKCVQSLLKKRPASGLRRCRSWG